MLLEVVSSALHDFNFVLDEVLQVGIILGFKLLASSEEGIELHLID
jgi:hypothetical protein